MKLKRVLALVLMLIITLSCINITVFAADDDCPTCGGDGKIGEQNDTVCTVCFGTGKLASLDLEEGGDYSDTKTDIKQTYTATVNDAKNQKTKVQVSWELQDIAVTVTSNKIWNTETLTWDLDTSKTNGVEVSDPTASFDFVNFSSKSVYAKLTFTESEGYNKPAKAFTDNNETEGEGDGIIKLGTKSTSDETDNTGKIKLSLTVNDADFDGESAGVGTYGTYTVMIYEQFGITVADADSFSEADINNNETIVTGETVTLKFKRVKDNNSFGSSDGLYHVEILNADSTITYLDENGQDIDGTSNIGVTAVAVITNPTDEVYVTVKTDTCLAEGTLISMADGTYKKIEDVVEGDLVKTFDHEKGEISSAAVYLNFTYPEKKIPFTLYFDGNFSLKLTCGHSLLEKTSRKYVSVNMGNVDEYIGKSFYAEDGKWHELLSYEIGTEPCNWYNLYTAYHVNSFADGMLQTSSDVDCYLNLYELDENLKADSDQLANDIEQYGLFDFEEIRGLYDIDEEWFNMTNGKYNYVIIGKGLATYEYFEWLNADM